MFTLGDVADILDSALDTGISIVDTLAKLSDIADEGNIDREKCFENLDIDDTVTVDDNEHNLAPNHNHTSREVNYCNSSSENRSKTTNINVKHDNNFHNVKFNTVSCDIDIDGSVNETESSSDDKYLPNNAIRRGTFVLDTSIKTANDAARQGLPIIEALGNLCSVADNFIKDYNKDDEENTKVDDSANIARKKSQENDLEYVINDRVNKILESFQNLDSTVDQIKQDALQYHHFDEVKDSDGFVVSANFPADQSCGDDTTETYATVKAIRRNKKRSPRPKTMLLESTQSNDSCHSDEPTIHYNNNLENSVIFDEQGKEAISNLDHLLNKQPVTRTTQKYGKTSRNTYLISTQINTGEDVDGDCLDNENIFFKPSFDKNNNEKQESYLQSKQSDNCFPQRISHTTEEPTREVHENYSPIRPVFERSLSNIEKNQIENKSLIHEFDIGQEKTRLSRLSVSLPDLIDKPSAVGDEPVNHIMSKLGLLNKVMSASLTKLTELHNVKRLIHLSSESLNIYDTSSDPNLKFENGYLENNSLQRFSRSAPFSSTESLISQDNDNRSNSGLAVLDDDQTDDDSSDYRPLSSCSRATYTISPPPKFIEKDILFDSDAEYNKPNNFHESTLNNYVGSEETKYIQTDAQLSNVEDIIHRLENKWNKKFVELQNFEVNKEEQVQPSDTVVLRKGLRQQNRLNTGTYVLNAVKNEKEEKKHDSDGKSCTRRSTYVLNNVNTFKNSHEVSIYDDTLNFDAKQQPLKSLRNDSSIPDTNAGHKNVLNNVSSNQISDLTSESFSYNTNIQNDKKSKLNKSKCVQKNYDNDNTIKDSCDAVQTSAKKQYNRSESYVIYRTSDNDNISCSDKEFEQKEVQSSRKKTNQRDSYDKRKSSTSDSESNKGYESLISRKESCRRKKGRTQKEQNEINTQKSINRKESYIISKSSGSANNMLNDPATSVNHYIAWTVDQNATSAVNQKATSAVNHNRNSKKLSKLQRTDQTRPTYKNNENKKQSQRSTYILSTVKTDVSTSKVNNQEKSAEKKFINQKSKKLHPETPSKHKSFLKRTSVGYNSKTTSLKEHDEPLTARLAALRMQLEEKRRQFEEEKKKKQLVWSQERAKNLQDAFFVVIGGKENKDPMTTQTDVSSWEVHFNEVNQGEGKTKDEANADKTPTKKKQLLSPREFIRRKQQENKNKPATDRGLWFVDFDEDKMPNTNIDEMVDKSRVQQNHDAKSIETPTEENNKHDTSKQTDSSPSLSIGGSSVVSKSINTANFKEIPHLNDSRNVSSSLKRLQALNESTSELVSRVNRSDELENTEENVSQAEKNTSKLENDDEKHILQLPEEEEKPTTYNEPPAKVVTHPVVADNPKFYPDQPGTVEYVEDVTTIETYIPDERLITNPPDVNNYPYAPDQSITPVQQKFHSLNINEELPHTSNLLEEQNTPVKTPFEQNTPVKTLFEQSTPVKTLFEQNTPIKTPLEQNTYFDTPCNKNTPNKAQTQETRQTPGTPESSSFAFTFGDEMMENPGLTPEQLKKKERFLKNRLKRQEAELEKKRKKEEKLVEQKLKKEAEERQLEEQQMEEQLVKATNRLHQDTYSKRIHELTYNTDINPAQQRRNMELRAESASPAVQQRVEAADDNSSSTNSFSEYKGPAVYQKPSGKSNKKIIQNAIMHCCLSGEVNKEAKKKCVEAIFQSEASHFLVLFREGLKFRSVYEYRPESETVTRIYGIGPKNITPKMMNKFFKYNSGAKEFNALDTKHLSIQIDGLMIKKELWEKKPNLASKTNSNFRKKPPTGSSNRIPSR